MFYYLSKTMWLLIQPVGLICLIFAGILLLLLFKRTRIATWLAFLGLCFALVATQTNAGRLLLQPLENRFARPDTPPASDEIAGIVVLGGAFDGYVTRIRGGFELGASGDRMVEALRLARLYPDKPVIVSGGEASLIGQTEGDASIASRFFASFGIPSDRVVLEDKSLNTHENAVLSKAVMERYGEGDWLLVTSAFHMPRSIGAFRVQGIEPVPWPVDYKTAGTESFAVGRDDPTEALVETNLAIREWIGLAVYAATGRISDYFPR